MKDALKRYLQQQHPELAEGLHLPAFAVVTAIPDPPESGGTCRLERPRYAVNCRLLNGDLDYDASMPELLDVPVSLPAAGGARGLAALPQPGTVVEIAFAYGRLAFPFVRCALPYNLALPEIGAAVMRWQHSAGSWQEVDADGNWRRVSPDTITDVAARIWIGTDAENLLALVSEFMGSVVAALNTLATHTHPSVSVITQGADVAARASEIAAQSARLGGFTQ